MKLFKVFLVLMASPLVGGVLGSIVGFWLFGKEPASDPANRLILHLSLGIGFVGFLVPSVLFAVRTLRSPTHQETQ